MAAAEDNIVSQTAQADEDRTKRLFIGFLTSALGYDQTMTGQDGTVASPVNQYQIANPDGSFSVQGKSSSNLNSNATAATASAPALNMPMLLVLIVAAVLILK